MSSATGYAKRSILARIAIPLAVAVVSVSLGWFLKPEREQFVVQVMPEWMPPQSDVDEYLQQRWQQYRLERIIRERQRKLDKGEPKDGK